MIRKESIALAENIAVAIHGEALVPSSDILMGLNDVSYGAITYSANWREELIEVTTNLSPHTAVVEAGATRFAEIIRGGFDMVKTYGVPLASAIADGVSILYTPNQLADMSNGQLKIRFANIDHPFFNSSIYPTEVKNKALGFDSIGLDVLKSLEFKYPDSAELKEYLATSHPEVLEIINSKETSLESAFYSLHSTDELDRMFLKHGDAYNFTRVKSIDIDLLLAMYIVISKMYSADKPCPWLEKGSLQEYREWVEIMWNGLTTYLIALRNTMTTYRARKLVVVDNKSPELVDYVPNERLGVSVKVVSGDVTAYFTNDVVREAETNGVALADVVLASIYSRLSTGTALGLIDLLGSKTGVQEQLSAYHGMLHNSLDEKAYDYFVKSSLQAIAKFVIDNPAAQEALTRTVNDQDSSVLTIIRERLTDDIDKLYYLFANEQKRVSGDAEISVVEAGSPDPYRESCINTVLKTKLVPIFLRLLGCDLAAEILELTYHTSEVEDNLHGMRERMHGALIEFIASKLLV